VIEKKEIENKHVKIHDLDGGITAYLCSEDEKKSCEMFDFLAEAKKHLNPYPYMWKDLEVSQRGYIQDNPYKDVDRTIMPLNHLCGGSVALNFYTPDGMRGSFGVVNRQDQKGLHHNFDYWWTDFNGDRGVSKDVKGHNDFDLEIDVKLKVQFGGEEKVHRFKSPKKTQS